MTGNRLIACTFCPELLQPHNICRLSTLNKQIENIARFFAFVYRLRQNKQIHSIKTTPQLINFFQKLLWITSVSLEKFRLISNRRIYSNKIIFFCGNNSLICFKFNYRTKHRLKFMEILLDSYTFHWIFLHNKNWKLHTIILIHTIRNFVFSRVRCVLNFGVS